MTTDRGGFLGMLKRNARALVSVVIIFALIFLFNLARENSTSYQKCQAEYIFRSTAQQNAANQFSLIDHVFAPKCTAIFLDQHNGFITAISTVLLMAITGGLVFIGYLQIQTTRRQLRAYIFTDSSGISDGANHPSAAVPVQQGCPNFHVRIKNSGQTPAYDVRHVARIEIVPVAAPITLIEDAIVEVAPPSAIPPNGTTFNDGNLGRALTAYEINALAATAQMLVVYGRIRYCDAFGTVRHTYYRLAYAGQWPIQPGVSLVFTQNGNGAD